MEFEKEKPNEERIEQYKLVRDLAFGAPLPSHLLTQEIFNLIPEEDLKFYRETMDFNFNCELKRREVMETIGPELSLWPNISEREEIIIAALIDPDNFENIVSRIKQKHGYKDNRLGFDILK